LTITEVHDGHLIFRLLSVELTLFVSQFLEDGPKLQAVDMWYSVFVFAETIIEL